MNLAIGANPPAYWPIKYRNKEGVIITRGPSGKYALLYDFICPLFIFSESEARSIAQKTEKGKKVLVNLLFKRCKNQRNILITDLINIIYYAKNEGAFNQ